MITFADGNEPPIIKGITEKDSPFYNVKKSIRDPWFLKFNNSAIYENPKNDDNKFTELFWKVCMNSFELFY